MSQGMQETTARLPPLVPVATAIGPFIAGGEHLLLLIPHEEGLLQAEAMETFFQACSTEVPFALELVGTHREQGFVLRASSEDQLTLLSKQVEAQYPQVEIQRLASSVDPLLLRLGEHAVVGEFALTGPSWLPLKTFTGKALAEPGADPLAGILAAMETVTSGERVICQLALVRAPESWIAPGIRKTVEHPLQEERDRAMAQLRTGGNLNPNAIGVRLLVGLFSTLAALAGYRWYQQWQAGARIGLPLWEQEALGGLVLLLLLGLGIWRLRRQPVPLADPKMVAEKLKHAAFSTQLRVIVLGRETTSSQARLRIVLSHLESAYRQLTLASANGLRLRRVRHLTPDQPHAQTLPSAAHAFPFHHPLCRLWHGGAWGPDVWNGLELSGVFHLPQETTDLPLVRRLSVKELLFSPEVAQDIKTTPATLPPTLIGLSKHRRYVVEVLLPFLTLVSHMVFVGRSRSGKTVAMQRMIQGIMQPVTDDSLQPGLFVIDPHHDLVEDVLGLVPPERLADVLLLDFTDTDFPVGLNPLDATMAFTRDQAISNLMSCFEGVWKEFWGPRMSYFLKNVCLLLYTLNADLVKAGKPEQQYTILDINPLLQYPHYAQKVLNTLDKSETWHQELLAWWKNVYFTLPEKSSFRQEIIMPILTKIGVFNDNQVLRRIVGQPITTAPIQEAITKGKIVLCGLSSRDMDDAAVNILGSTLINLLHRSFAIQQQFPLQQRRRVLVAVDELQNFSGSLFDKLLSEDAKFGCSMVLSTQNLKRLNQIKEGLLEMVLSNCENLCAFAVSATDAKLLEEEFQKKVTQKHLLAQPRLHCYVRLAIAGHTLQFASVQISPPASWTKDGAQLARIAQVRQQNRTRFLSMGAVDARYAAHLAQFLRVDFFAEKLDRNQRAAKVTQQQREEAAQLAAHVRENHIPLTPASAPSTPGSVQGAVQATPSAEQAVGPTGIPSSSLPVSRGAGGTAMPQYDPSSSSGEKGRRQGERQEAAGTQHDRRRRNHSRSSRGAQKVRHVQKTPGGAPPPGLAADLPDNGDTSPRVTDDAQEFRPLPGLPFMGGGGGWEREGRERG